MSNIASEKETVVAQQTQIENLTRSVRLLDKERNDLKLNVEEAKTISEKVIRNLKFRNEDLEHSQVSLKREASLRDLIPKPDPNVQEEVS